ncbi:MAG TPA: MFS transporter [Desulfobacteraceae bacterium]|nr:MFS transporter [Desulfobacteraceae bacterium]
MTKKMFSGWRESLAAFWHPRVITMLFFGFSAGVPILLIFSSLSLWLREAGVERSAVTFFSWAALGYSFKYVWAPLVDQMPLPLLTRWLGRRRGWILVSQAGIVTAILWMAFTDPASGHHQLTVMAMAAVLLGFSSANQDIVIDAYRIESAGEALQAMMASAYIAGYRIGMLVAGAGALFLADALGSAKGAYLYDAWRTTYMAMAGVMGIGIITTLMVKEPAPEQVVYREYGTMAYVRAFVLFLLAAAGFVLWFSQTAGLAAAMKIPLGQLVANDHLAGFVVEGMRLAGGIGVAVLIARGMTAAGFVDKVMVRTSYVTPISEFYNRYGRSLAWLLLSLIGLYRVSDIVLGVISNVFYQDLGFSKSQIAGVVKTFGLLMTIAGGFLGGMLSVRFGVIRILFTGALLASLTNLLFVAMANVGPSMPMLYLVISADNLAAGLASAAFVAFLSSLTNIRFTGVQYALFSSLMTLFPKTFSGYSGTMVDTLGYPGFFTMTAVMGLPVLVLVWLCGKYLRPGDTGDGNA